jgi:oligoribonuclease
MPPDPDRLVWIDLEMSGLDPDRCVILEIATVVTTARLEDVADGPNLVIHHDGAALQNLSEWCRQTFAKSGLLERVRTSAISTLDAEELTLAFLGELVPPQKSPMCGNSVHNDRAFLARHMPRLHDFFHYRNLDVSTVKELVRRWYGPRFQPPKKADAHEALRDIRESVGELRYYRDSFFVT